MKKTWDRSAMRFASARYLERQCMLEVAFENGDQFRLATESLLPQRMNGLLPAARFVPGSKSATPDWARVHIGETGDVLEVPVGKKRLEIPWDRIRALGDADFRAHLTDKATERARALGQRIRALRIEAGLTQAAVAARAGVPRQTVARVEAGRIGVELDLIEPIALALGRGWSDLAEE